MPTEAKQATVAELKDELSKANGDNRGRLSRPDRFRHLRRSSHPARRGHHAIGWSRTDWPRSPPKRRATGELNELLSGPSALAMGSGDEAHLAKTFLDAIKPSARSSVRGAVLNGKRVDADAVTRLATLPSRDVLLGQLAGGIVSPLSSMASLLAAPLRNLGYALQQVADQKSANQQA